MSGWCAEHLGVRAGPGSRDPGGSAKIRQASSLISTTSPRRVMASTPLRILATMWRKNASDVLDPGAPGLGDSTSGRSPSRGHGGVWERSRHRKRRTSSVPPQRCALSPCDYRNWIMTRNFGELQKCKHTYVLRSTNAGGFALQHLPLAEQIAHFPHQGLVLVDDRFGLVVVVVEAGAAMTRFECL